MSDYTENDLANPMVSGGLDDNSNPAVRPSGSPTSQVNQNYPDVPGRGPEQARTIGSKRSAWAVWWLSGLTFGIYYLVWYYKINSELRAFAPDVVQVSPGKATVAQILPIFAWVSLAHTSARLNAAHRAIGSPVQVSGGISILGTFWFNSQTRYLQRRLNSLWDAQDTLNARWSQ